MLPVVICKLQVGDFVVFVRIPFLKSEHLNKINDILVVEAEKSGSISKNEVTCL